jgi:hypothetical protein
MVPVAPIIAVVTFVFTLLLLFVITFLQGIYNYIPEKSTFLGYIVLHLFCSLQFMLQVVLFPMLNVFLLLR